jgi:hypothetical protein
MDGSREVREGFKLQISSIREAPNLKRPIFDFECGSVSNVSFPLTPTLSPTGTIQLKYSFSRVCWVYVFAHSTA